MVWGVLYLKESRFWSFPLEKLSEVHREFNKKGMSLHLFQTQCTGDQLFYIQDDRGKRGRRKVKAKVE